LKKHLTSFLVFVVGLFSNFKPKRVGNLATEKAELRKILLNIIFFLNTLLAIKSETI
jgi:hypothetical protein